MKTFMRAFLTGIVFGTGALWVHPVAADMWVTDSGNVGIGTAAPKTLLEISRNVDPAAGGSVLRISNASGADWRAGQSVCGIEFGKENLVNAYIRSVHTRSGGPHPGADAGLVFGTSTAADPIVATDRMVIDSDGNVGIGTLSPQSRLQIDGSDNPWLLITGADNGFLGLRACSGNPHHSNIFYDRRGDLIFAAQPFNNRASGDGAVEILRLKGDCGYVGIGTASPAAPLDVNGEMKSNSLKVEGHAEINRLDVAGTITARQLVLTEISGGADFVFQDGYHLAPLEQVAAYVDLHKHLPGVPSAAQSAKEGVELTRTLTRHLQKIEELTLYLIQMKDENQKLRERLFALESRINAGADRAAAGEMP